MKKAPYLISKALFFLSIFVFLCGLEAELFAATSQPIATPPAAGSLAQNTSFPIENSTAQRIQIKDVSGDIYIKKSSANDFSKWEEKMSLEMGDTLQTREGNGRLLFDNDTEIVVGPQTTLFLSEALWDKDRKNHSTLLNLMIGKLKVDVHKMREGSRFQIITPTAVASVRGTSFFIYSGANQGQSFTDLFVKQSEKGIVFTNTIGGDSRDIFGAQGSRSSENGQLDEPRPLTDAEFQALLEEWNKYQNSSNDSEDEEEGSDESDDADTDDAENDRKSEGNIPGQKTIEDIIKIIGKESFVDLLEKEMLQRELGRIQQDQHFDQADAELARMSDLQTAKVFRDVHGNRVRVDQYIFHEPNSDKVQFLSLTARAGQYQTGVSSLLFTTQFNRSLTQNDPPFRDLPWADYMNVVTSEEFFDLFGALIGDYGDGEIGIGEGYDIPGQFIVHEINPELALGENPLYPMQFGMTFANPFRPQQNVRDYVQFGETYSPPLDLSEVEGPLLVVQALLHDFTAIDPAQGDKIRIDFYSNTSNTTITINDGEPMPFYEDYEGGGGHDAPQSSKFAGNYIPGNLIDINYYRNLPQNEDGNPENDDHPAHFDQHLNGRWDGETFLGTNKLIGVFVPIDNQGHPIEMPMSTDGYKGFSVHGLRDLLSPNPLVNGGNYNLEVIFFYGYTDDSENDMFHEDFRIDTIITPEIFTAVPTGNQSTLFPATLMPDEDDYPTGPV